MNKLLNRVEDGAQDRLVLPQRPRAAECDLRRHMAAKHPEALAEHGIAPDTTTEATA